MAGTIKNISKITQTRGATASFGEVFYQPGGAFGPRTQTQFQLVAMHTGEAFITIDGADLHLAASHVALLKPGHREHFVFSATTVTHHTWCAISPEAVGAPLRARLKRATPFALPLSWRMENVIRLGLWVDSSGAESVSQLIERLAEAAVQEFVAEHDSQNEACERVPLPVQKARKLIEERLAQPLTLPQIARESGVSPNHLIKLFKQHLDATPSRYLWQARTQKGLQLIRETGLSISEIADATGFKNPFHFSRLVKQRYAVSPTNLRRRDWKPRG